MIWRRKLKSIDFTRQVAEDSRSAWLQTLCNQVINENCYVQTYTDRKYRGDESPDRV